MIPRSALRLTGIAAVLAMPLSVAACGDDSSGPAAPVTTPSAVTSAPAATTSAAPSASDAEQGEDHEIVPDAEVTDGFAKTNADLVRISADAALATDDAVEGVFEGWESYEGTVKQNDPDSYLTLEDALSAFKAAAEAHDADAMASAAGDFAAASQNYLGARVRVES